MRGIAAQSTEDGRRFRRLGALEEQVTVTGNLKYDLEPDPGWAPFAREFRERAGQRPVWIAASTHVDEEAPVLEIHARLRKRWPDLLLLWAPRHPERFRAVTQQAVDAGMRTATRTLTREPDAADAVFVIDTLGELASFYACADVAFVGGSLQDVGGHNLLEPASTGTAMVTGPHLHNFADIARRLREVDALCVGRNADAVRVELEALLADPRRRQRMADAALALVDEGRGAVERTLAVVRRDLAETPAAGAGVA